MIKDIKARLRAANIENTDLEARWILKHVLGVSDTDLVSGAEFPVSQIQKQTIDSMISRRAAGEPLSRIFGEREFWGHAFKINPDVLDPRPDTETLVEAVIYHLKQAFHVKQENHLKAAEILDLGTGSGCILVSILKELPYVSGIGVDRSFKACRTALENVRALGVADRATVICGSWGESLDGLFDIVVSNPPYIPSADIPNLEVSVRNHDPILALEGGGDGLLAYKNIFSILPRLLKPQGRAFFEIGYNQKDDLERLSGDYEIRIESVHYDLAGHPRVVEISRGDN